MYFHASPRQIGVELVYEKVKQQRISQCEKRHPADVQVVHRRGVISYMCR